jgi:hypothetical protein
MTKDLEMLLNNKVQCPKLYSFDQARRIVREVILLNNSSDTWYGKGVLEPKEPMGVSQWINYGRKYGYDKYFKKQVIKEILPKEMINTKEESDPDWFLGYGFNMCLKQIKDRIKV